MSENFRESSKRIWNSACTVEHINAGSLQRIADAAETMAKRFSDLLSDVETYKRYWKQEEERRWRLERKVIALRGHMTRLKNKHTRAA